ncbi:MAG: ABC transporter permease subunit [Acidimicrobiia bacterium]|nr:ABC transporter permease subunit [Acidimicrobiia bacterium]
MATAPTTTEVRERGAPGRSGRQRFDNNILPVLLVTPAMILIVGLIGYPVLRTLYLSFREAGLASLTTGESEFVGLANYAEILTDSGLRRAVVVTIIFGLACVAGTMILGVAVALLLNSQFRGKYLVMIAVLLPWAMPRVAAATVWEWLFHDQYGFVNWALSGLGFDFEGNAWFIDPFSAFSAIGVVVIWQSFPFVAIAVLAGLQTISDDVSDATLIDGATGWQRLRYVTLPMLKPILLVMVILSTIWDFKVFDQIYVMTGGGPARSTEVLSIATYREAFTQLNFGLGSSLAMFTFVILIFFTVIYIRLVRDEEAI